MGREVGGGIGMGKTCEPKAFSFQCMTKFTTNKKKIKKQTNKQTPHEVSERNLNRFLQGFFSITLENNSAGLWFLNCLSANYKKSQAIEICVVLITHPLSPTVIYHVSLECQPLIWSLCLCLFSQQLGFIFN